MFRKRFLKVKLKLSPEREARRMDLWVGEEQGWGWLFWQTECYKQDPGTRSFIPVGSGTKQKGRARER